MAMEMVAVDEKSSDLTSLIGIVFFLLFLNSFIMSKNFFSPFSYVIQLFPGAFAGIFRNIHQDVEDSNEEQKLSIQEVKKMMESLQNVCDSDEDEGEGMEELFELEPSIEEVKEAFDVFDENEDGFIDSKELQRVLSVMEFSQISEAQSERMIRAFDCNGDGRIDFQEFLQLTEQSFQQFQSSHKVLSSVL